MGHWPASRFLSPLIEPDVRFSRIRLSDWLHAKACGVPTRCNRQCSKLED